MHLYRSLRRCFLIVACLALASFLAGCDAKPPVTIHTFADKMDIIPIPELYLVLESMVLGTDGNLWFPTVAFSNFGNSQTIGAIDRVTPGGKVSMFSLPPNNYPSYITRGADGNFWFIGTQGAGKVEHGVDTYPGFSGEYQEIGSMTPTGTFHMIPLSTTPDRYPNSITAGPDGNLWFTEVIAPGPGEAATVSKIARMTPAGALTEFTLAPASDVAEIIMTGPDGNLWFTIGSSRGNNAYWKVGRITPQGKITVFGLPDNVYNAGNLTTGPDGNLWLSVGRYIVRITPNGQMKEFPLPTIAGKSEIEQPAAADVVAGPDGALWFLTYYYGVWRMTLDGKFQQYHYPAKVPFPSSDVRALLTTVLGADGTLWFTNGNQLGHFV